MKHGEYFGENQEYVALELIRINQRNRIFFVTKILAVDFLKMYTVEPTTYDHMKYTNLAKIIQSEEEYYNSLASQYAIESGFQRKLDGKRVNEIADFLNTNDYPLFPNSIIATCDLINGNEYFEKEESVTIEDFVNLPNKLSNLAFFFENMGKSFILLPLVKSSLLIIDGQHRIKGLENANQEVINNYELILSLILDYDRAVIAKLFYTINYEQRSVNKSLLYHLTGEFSSKIGVITYLHYTAKLLNEIPNSPFFGKIKMLGIVPENIDLASKQRLSISQAFFIDELRRFIDVTYSKQSYLRPIFRWYYERDKYQVEIIKFLAMFFNVVSKIKKMDWADPKESSLSKGIGVGALLRVMNAVFIDLFVNRWDCDPLRINKNGSKEIEELLEGFSDFDYRFASKGIGGLSGINKIAIEIISGLNYFKKDGPSDFESKFKKITIDKYDIWLKENL